MLCSFFANVVSARCLSVTQYTDQQNAKQIANFVRRNKNRGANKCQTSSFPNFLLLHNIKGLVSLICYTASATTVFRFVLHGVNFLKLEKHPFRVKSFTVHRARAYSVMISPRSRTCSADVKSFSRGYYKSRVYTATCRRVCKFSNKQVTSPGTRVKLQAQPYTSG